MFLIYALVLSCTQKSIVADGHSFYWCIDANAKSIGIGIANTF